MPKLVLWKELFAALLMDNHLNLDLQEQVFWELLSLIMGPKKESNDELSPWEVLLLQLGSGIEVVQREVNWRKSFDVPCETVDKILELKEVKYIQHFGEWKLG